MNNEVKLLNSLISLLDRVGHTPLPPYIDRDDSIEDTIFYQSLFAKKPGAVAVHRIFTLSPPGNLLAQTDGNSSFIDYFYTINGFPLFGGLGTFPKGGSHLVEPFFLSLGVWPPGVFWEFPGSFKVKILWCW